MRIVFGLLALGALLLVAAIAGTVILLTGGSDEGNAASSTKTAGVQLQLDKVVIIQAGKAHEIPPGSFRDQVKDLVLEPDPALLVLTFTDDKVPVGEQVTLVNEQAGSEDSKRLDVNGQVGFGLNLVVDDQPWKFDSYELKAQGNDRIFQILVMQGYAGGNVSSTMNTADGLGVPVQSGQPTTSGVEVSPVFQNAFAEFCGFSVSDGVKARLEPNDEPRHQVAFTGGSFVESSHVIAVDQPIWVVVSKDGDRCYVNPPCGNPQVIPGKLPPAPLGLQPPRKEAHPTPTKTPVGPSPAPSVTPGIPTATPFTPPTQTPEARPTPVPPCLECLPPPTEEPLPPDWPATATPVSIWNPTPVVPTPVGPPPTVRPPPNIPTPLP
jgi:hypothetical protein